MATRLWTITVVVLGVLIQAHGQLHPDGCNNVQKFLSPIEAELPIRVAGKDAINLGFESPADVSASINAFGFKLFKQVLEEAPEENVVFSPLSIAAATSLLHIGAAGETRAEIGHVLEYVSDCYPFLLQDVLKGYEIDETAAEQLAIATRLFRAESLPLKDDFVNVVGKENVEATDFGNPKEAAKEINDWVADRTKGLIDELIPPEGLDSATVMALVNALYFKGKWAVPFDPKFTAQSPFNGTKGMVDTDFMSRTGRTRFDAKNKIVELPYENGRFSMLIVLSSSNGALTVADIVGAGRFLLESASYEEGEMEVRIPKFSFEKEYNLDRILPQMGMELLFTDFADLSGISDVPLKVDTAVHKARILVNEEGTEAAAATAFTIVPLVAPEEFVADQPFVFVIRDNANGLFLFMGAVSEM